MIRFIHPWICKKYSINEQTNLIFETRAKSYWKLSIHSYNLGLSKYYFTFNIFGKNLGRDILQYYSSEREPFEEELLLSFLWRSIPGQQTINIINLPPVRGTIINIYILSKLMILWTIPLQTTLIKIQSHYGLVNFHNIIVTKSITIFNNKCQQQGLWPVET